MEIISPRLRAELEEALSQPIQVFFELKLKPQGDGSSHTRVTDRQLQLATAVLLLEAARCDFDLRADEFNAVLGAVRRMMGLTEEEAVAVIRFAEEEVRQSKRLYEFTNLIKVNYTADQKKALVQCLWQVVFADAQLVASEEYIVRKIADLVEVPLADFLDAKIKARDTFR